MATQQINNTRIMGGLSISIPDCESVTLRLWWAGDELERLRAMKARIEETGDPVGAEVLRLRLSRYVQIMRSTMQEAARLRLFANLKPSDQRKIIEWSTFPNSFSEKAVTK